VAPKGGAFIVGRSLLRAAGKEWAAVPSAPAALRRRKRPEGVWEATLGHRVMPPGSTTPATVGEPEPNRNGAIRLRRGRE
jgi:hypothetical protein